MKNFIFIFLSSVLFSCNDKSPDTSKTEEIYSISRTETLEVLLATAIPIEGGYSISKQAENFEVSEIQYRDKGIYYVYAPEDGYAGTEVVKIKREDSNGAEVYAETITTLNIKVTD